MSSNEALDMDQSHLLSDATLAALELLQQPFDSVEPSNTGFSDETTVEQISDVKQALITGDDLLLVLGEHGAGKTVMLKQLGELSGNRIQCFSVKGSERFSTMNLFAGMLEAFKHSPPEQLQDILDDLIPYLQSMITGNTLSVIVLDDAHKVKEHELTQLLSAMLYVNSHDETVMRIAMAAPPEFEDHIPELLPAGADLPYSSLTITGLNSNRAGEFLDLKMQQAGLQGESPFSDTDIQDLADRTMGLPGPLQSAAADALNEQYGPIKRDLADPVVMGGAGSSLLQSRFAKMALGAVAVIFIALGILMSLPGKSNEDAGRLTISTTEPVNIDGSNPELRLIENEEIISSPTLTESRTSTTTRITIDELEENSRPATLTESTSTGSATTSASSSEINSEPAPVSTPDTSLSETAPVEQEPVVIVAAPTPTINEEAPQPSTDTAPPQAAETAAAPVVNAAPIVAAPSTTTSQGGLLESSSWILLQDRAQFTVQMSASRDRNSVLNFLNNHSETLSPPNSIYSFVRDGSTWYALLHGLYPSTAAAKAAVQLMPAAAQTNQPWIRSVARVQDVLKAQ